MSEFPKISIKEDWSGRTTIKFDGHEIKGVYGYRVWRDSRADVTHIELAVRNDALTMDFDGKTVPELPEPYKYYYKPINEAWEKAAGASED